MISLGLLFVNRLTRSLVELPELEVGLEEESSNVDELSLDAEGESVDDELGSLFLLTLLWLLESEWE